MTLFDTGPHPNKPPFFKKRIHILIEGTDRELVYDVEPGYGEASMLTKALKKAEEHLRTCGLQGTIKTMDGIEPDATIIPDFTILDRAHEVPVTHHVVHCEAAERLGEIRATLLVNYGPEAKKHPNGIEIKKDKSVLKMLIDVLEQCSHRIDKIEEMRPKYKDQVVTQGALDALIGQRDAAWRERYLDRSNVLGKLYQNHTDTESDTISGSAVRAMLKEEEEKIPPEPECKTIIHAMAEHPDEVANRVAKILMWAGHAGGPMAIPSDGIVELAAWLRGNGYEFEEFT